MGSVIVGPQTAQRLLDIHAPEIRLDEVPTKDVILSTGARLLKFNPGEGTLNTQYGDHSYLVTGQAMDSMDITQLGLDPDPNIFV